MPRGRFIINPNANQPNANQFNQPGQPGHPNQPGQMGLDNGALPLEIFSKNLSDMLGEFRDMPSKPKA